MKKANGDWLYFIWMTLLPLLVSIESSYLVYNFTEILLNQSWVYILLIYIGIGFAMGLAIIPTTMVSILSGYLFGLNSLPLLIFSYLLASLIGFLLGKIIQPTSIKTLIQKKKNISLVNNSIEDEPFKWIFFMRLSPVLPFALSNAYLSLLKIPFKYFISGSALGMLPRTIIAIWTGSEIQNLSMIIEGKIEANIQNYLSLGFLIISIIGFYFLIRKRIIKG
ncbi:MAG: hypothetical protein RIR51_293 [Bacteroidota bacterium]|jgi:uncharacterized membrane protein YdjX (TVP38/TMEM64 family)